VEGEIDMQKQERGEKKRWRNRKGEKGRGGDKRKRKERC
jgi:hypothetical protein